MFPNTTLRPVSGGDDFREVLTAERVNALQDGLRAAQNGDNIRAVGGGLRISRGANGVTLRLRRQRRGAAVEQTTPWFCSDGPDVTVGSGTIARAINTTLNGVLLISSSVGTVSVPTEGDGEVWIKMTADLTADPRGRFIVDVRYNSSIIEAGTATPDDDEAAGLYYVRLASYLDGVKIKQWVTNNIACEFSDSSSGSTAKAKLTTGPDA
jgi:hypothetical protein